MLNQVDSTTPVERDPLGFQQLPLQFVRIAAAARADLAGGIHDPVPRKLQTFRKCMQRITDLTRLTFETGESRNLTVSCDLPGRNLSHDAASSGSELHNCIFKWPQ